MIQALSIVFSFFIVSFGQPAFSSFLGIIASVCGYALFWSVLIHVPSLKKRFWCATIWFSCIQGVQLAWLLSHPFAYIYGLYLFLCLAIGAQFGCIGILITPQKLKSYLQIFAIAGFYTIFEWLRLFFFSGFSLNPVGLALTSTLYGLQNASLFGVYGLTFYVLLMNLLVLRFFLNFQHRKTLVFVLALILSPYIFGYMHFEWHDLNLKKAIHNPSTSLNTLLVQTAFPVEEALVFVSLQEAVKYVEEEWFQILKIIQKYKNEKIELIVLPEYVVPYGTYVPIFEYKNFEKTFLSLFGEQGKHALPKLAEPLAFEANVKNGTWYVTNAYYCQTIANFFQADVVAGLQDDQLINEVESKSYSSAFYFWPSGDRGLRYEKQVLLPMGEYIPFEFCKALAAKYGITGSFCHGDGAKVFPGCKAPFGLSICYEETYGNLMLENRLKGAGLLINVTSDVWYPNSLLPKQHFDHARLRTVESGIPLVRACNTGITSAFNSLGEVIGSLKEEDEWVSQALQVKVPLYSYNTLYSALGDKFIILICFMLMPFLFKRSP